MVKRLMHLSAIVDRVYGTLGRKRGGLYGGAFGRGAFTSCGTFTSKYMVLLRVRYFEGMQRRRSGISE